VTAIGPRVPDYLAHLIEAIERIASYTTGMDEAAFRASPMTQDAVIRNLEVVGEASRNILREAPNFTARHPDLPLVAAYEMRNALAHGYFKIDFGVVWRTIQLDLPALHKQARTVLSALAEKALPPDEPGP
jgi:uncharacterized protein with HEPN domain